MTLNECTINNKKRTKRLMNNSSMYQPSSEVKAGSQPSGRPQTRRVPRTTRCLWGEVWHISSSDGTSLCPSVLYLSRNHCARTLRSACRGSWRWWCHSLHCSILFAAGSNLELVIGIVIFDAIANQPAELNVPAPGNLHPTPDQLKKLDTTS